MRNLKRALSLTLASVMLLGMMVVGSGAAKGYDDVSETDNVEAIEVLQKIEVMVGDDRGFGPERPVNRAEMAVVMGKLLNLDYNYYSATCPFNDVYDWARGWVGACAANGIVSGRGEGVYDPGATVTAVEAASMLLRALGYFKYQNDYADGFEVSTVRTGTKIGIFDQVGSSATEPMTRNQVAQMVLNALRSGMVEPDGQTINLTTPDGSVYTGKVNYVYVTNNKPFAKAISSVQATSIGSQNDCPIVELGEQLYNGDLRLNNYDNDVFGRPARTWEYKGEQIGTYVKKELLHKTYTEKVTGKDLYDLLTKNTIETYNFEIAIDGADTEEFADVLSTKSVTGDRGYGYFSQDNMVRTNTREVGQTGRGVLTEVYIDNNPEVYNSNNQVPGIVYIAVMNTYLAKATKDYDAKKDEVNFDIYALTNKTSKTGGKFLVKDKAQIESLKVSGENFDIAEIKTDDIVLVRVADNEVQQIIQPEVISETVVSSFNEKDSWLNADGTRYDFAHTGVYDKEALDAYTNAEDSIINMKEKTYDLYLDMFGNVIGVEANGKDDQYVFLTGLNGAYSNISATTARGNVIHMDGTMETVTIDLEKSRGACRTTTGHQKHGLITYADEADVNLSQLNTWCTYAVDKNGVYTLMEVTKTTNSASPVDGLGQFAQDVNTYYDVQGTPGVKEINNKRTSLRSSTAGIHGWNFGSQGTFVYGNDETVYINVKLKSIDVDDDVRDGANDKRQIVDKVDTTIVGIDKVNLEVNELGAADENGYLAPDAEIYTLYKKGDVIGAVTIGDDNGSTATWAYIISDKPSREDFEHDTDSSKAAQVNEWTWYRPAIVNGEKVDLIEISDTKLQYIGANDMLQGQWYEIKTNADGEVRDATPLREVLLDKGRWSDDATSVEFNLNDKERTAVLHDTYEYADGYAKASDGETETFTKAEWLKLTDDKDSLSFKNGTLYTNTDETKGFHVSKNVKVFVAFAELPRGAASGSAADGYGKHGDRSVVDEFDSVSDVYEGYEGVKAALKALDENFVGDLSAVFNAEGDATVIIFNDCWGTYINEGDKEPVDGGTTYTVTAPASLVLSLTADGPWSGSLTGVKATDVVYVKAADGATVNSVTLKGDALTSEDGVWSFQMSKYKTNLKSTDFKASSKIGGKLDTKISNLDISWTGTVSDGHTYVTLTLNEWPDWAPKTSGTTVAGDISATIEGAAIGTAQTVTFTYQNANDAGKWVVAGVDIDKIIDGTNIKLGEKATKEFIPSAVNVEYYDGDDNRVEGRLTGETETLTTTAAANVAIDFTVTDGTAAKNFRYTTTGTNANITDATSGANDDTAQKIIKTGEAGATLEVGSTNLAANGDSVVKVIIKGLEDVEETYTISTNAGAGIFHTTVGNGVAVSTFKTETGAANTATDKLVLAFDGATVATPATDQTTEAIAKGTNVTIKANVDAVTAGASDVRAYKVSIKVGEKTFSATFTGTGAKDLGTVKVNGNIVIDKTDITVTPILKNNIKSAAYKLDENGDAYVEITYDRAIKAASVSSTTVTTSLKLNLSKGTNGLSVKDNVVTVYLLAPVTSTQSKIITNTVGLLETDDTPCGVLNSVTLTKNADDSITASVEAT